tara:strand:+ start:8 stop:619 length:612 start_codon:yes stop_codon:yes gene_type:complete
MRSLSEIETTSKRASKAAGFSWGEAEEVGKSIRLLELFGLPGIQNLTQYYQKKEKKKFENISVINKNNRPLKNPFCPILLGICLLDQIRSLENSKIYAFNNVAFPILLLPFLSRSSEIIGKKILLKFDKNNYLLNFNLNIFSNSFRGKFPPLAKKTRIYFLDNKDNFSAKDWNKLYRLSENTFVEETDSLKKGAAGAGLTDND